VIVRAESIPAPTHGRVLIRDGVRVAVVGFHGYAQSAEDMMEVLAAIPGSEQLTLISVQALNRFYTRGDQKIVASWMTRQDREQAIADNVIYIDRVMETVETTSGVVFVGFSQGVAMAYRAALLGKRPRAGIIAIGGDVPPDVKDVPSDRWPRVLIAGGAADQWYTAEKIAADEAFLKGHGVAHEIYRHDAGHEVTTGVLDAIGRHLSSASSRNT
jgi:predicted esterase